MSLLSGLAAPGPTAIALTLPFWEGAAAGKLLIQRCGDCGTAVFYPRAMCPNCWSQNLSWEEASGRGTLMSFSEVWKPGHPAWQPAAPYVVGLVKIAEGPTMLSFIVRRHETLNVGIPLVLQPTNIGGRILPAFAPAAER